MQQLPDKAIIEKLKSTVYTDNDEAMSHLYALMYRKVVLFIQKNSGSEQDADDIFQDALIVFYKLAKASRLDEISNIHAYFFSICRNLWFKTLKKNQRVTKLTEEYNALPEAARQITALLSGEKSALLEQLLHSIGEGCQKVLVYYYYDRLKMKEIMKRLNFSSEQVAKNKKSSCIKKLKEIVKSNPGLVELLK